MGWTSQAAPTLRLALLRFREGYNRELNGAKVKRHAYAPVRRRASKIVERGRPVAVSTRPVACYKLASCTKSRVLQNRFAITFDDRSVRDFAGVVIRVL